MKNYFKKINSWFTIVNTPKKFFLKGASNYVELLILTFLVGFTLVTTNIDWQGRLWNKRHKKCSKCAMHELSNVVNAMGKRVYAIHMSLVLLLSLNL